MMAEDNETELYRRGYSGMPISEHPLVTGPRDFQHGLASLSHSLNSIQARDLARLMLILHGVKEGMVDPNQALVQGTPGGDLYGRHFGIQPPAAPTTYVSPGQPASIQREGAMAEPEAAGTAAPI